MKNQLRVFLFISACSLVLFASPVFAAEYHVTTGGSSSGSGSASSPWSLQTALSGGNGQVHGGDTIWVHGGTYTGQFTNDLNGDSTHQIIVRNYNGERATLDGGPNPRTDRDEYPTLLSNGRYTTFWGLEITTSGTDRQAALGGYCEPGNLPPAPAEPHCTPNNSHPFPSDFSRGDGIQFCNSCSVGSMPGMKLINMIIHDNRQGISLWKGTKNAEVYGNLIYNDGWSGLDHGHGHGIYGQNSSDSSDSRNITDNIIWGQFGYGMSLYGSSAAELDNFTLLGNVVFGHPDEAGILLGGNSIVNNPVLDSNMSYNDQVRLGYIVGANSANVRNNYIIASISADITIFRLSYTGCSNISSFTGNTIIGTIDTATGCNISSFSGNNINGSTPSLKVFVRGNTWEPGARANIVVFNPDGLSLVNADVSSLGLSNGTYQLHSAENYYGDITTINYSGGNTIPISMNGHSRVDPIGHSGQTFNSFPNFGTFILTKVGGGGDTSAPIISSVASSSITTSGATISWNTDESSDSQVEYGLSTAYGSNTATNTSLVSSHSQTLSGLNANTTYHYRVKSRDGSTNRNLGTSGDFTFATSSVPVDTTLPTVNAFTLPTSSAVLSVSISSLSASDNVGVTGYLVNESATKPLATASGWSASAPTSYTFASNTANGSKTLYAWAKDAANNVSNVFSDTVTINVTVVDTEYPTVSLTAPSNNTTVSGSSVTVSANANDNIGVVGVQFLRDGVNLGAEDTATPYSTTFNTTGVSNGTHTLSARARDAAGNSTTSAVVTVTVNNSVSAFSQYIEAESGTVVSPMAISSDSLASGGSYVTSSVSDTSNTGTGGSVSLTVNLPSAGTYILWGRVLSPDGNTDSMFVSVDNGTQDIWDTAELLWSPNWQWTRVTERADNGGSPSLNNTNPHLFVLNAGSHTFKFASRELNTKLDRIFITNDSTQLPGNTDNISPTINMTAPSNNTTVSGSSVTVSANASDNIGVVGVQFLRDGVNLGAEDTTAPYSTTFNTTGVSNGTHTLSARARDAAGNQTTATNVTVTVSNLTSDTVSPTISSFTAPATSTSLTIPISSFSASDNVGVTGYKVTGYREGQVVSKPFATDAGWSSSPQSSFTFGSEGSDILYAWAKDAAGNVSDGLSRSVTVTLPNNEGCVDPSPAISGTTSPCPLLSLSRNTLSTTIPLTITLTPGTERYLYRHVLISKGTSNCEGTDWCSFDLPTPYVYTDFKQTSSPLTITIPANTLSVGTHYILSWDWTLSGSCYVGPGSNSCGEGTWRMQKVEVTD